MRRLLVLVLAPSLAAASLPCAARIRERPTVIDAPFLAQAMAPRAAEFPTPGENLTSAPTASIYRRLSGSRWNWRTGAMGLGAVWPALIARAAERSPSLIAPQPAAALHVLAASTGGVALASLARFVRRTLASRAIRRSVWIGGAALPAVIAASYPFWNAPRAMIRQSWPTWIYHALYRLLVRRSVTLHGVERFPLRGRSPVILVGPHNNATGVDAAVVGSVLTTWGILPKIVAITDPANPGLRRYAEGMANGCNSVLLTVRRENVTARMIEFLLDPGVRRRAVAIIFPAGHANRRVEDDLRSSWHLTAAHAAHVGASMINFEVSGIPFEMNLIDLVRAPLQRLVAGEPPLDIHVFFGPPVRVEPADDLRQWLNNPEAGRGVRIAQSTAITNQLKTEAFRLHEQVVRFHALRESA